MFTEATQAQLNVFMEAALRESPLRVAAQTQLNVFVEAALRESLLRVALQTQLYVFREERMGGRAPQQIAGLLPWIRMRYL